MIPTVSRWLIKYHPFKGKNFRVYQSTFTKEHDSSEGENITNESERNGFLSFFASSKNSFLELHKFNPFDPTLPIRYKSWKKRRDLSYLVEDQRYIEERHKILGNDLATAHFIVFRGGRVKNYTSTDWIIKPETGFESKDLPSKFSPGWHLKEIDCTGLPLCYEGLKNFVDLKYVDSLILRGCPLVDEWFLDRISQIFGETLKHLDISDCPRITERALACIYRFDKLETLKIYNIVNTVPFKLSCYLLEDAKPNLKLEGVE